MFEHIYRHFGLRENPFPVASDSRFYFFKGGHDGALTELLHGLEAGSGLLVLTGEAGVGKTTLLHRILDWLEQRNCSSAYVFHPLVESADLLELILRDFGATCGSMNKNELVAALQGWLLRRHALGDSPVVILDEAQALRSDALKELQVLLDLEAPRGKLLQIILAGQPELEEKLRRAELRQIQQRVMLHARLHALDGRDTISYIEARLAAAGAAGQSVFSEQALQAICDSSGGIPRVIHLLCEHSLLQAYAGGARKVTGEMVQQIARQFDLAGKPETAGTSINTSTFARLLPLLGTQARALQAAVALEEMAGKAGDREDRPVLTPAVNVAAVAPQEKTDIAAPTASWRRQRVPGQWMAFVRARNSALAYCQDIRRSFLRDYETLVRAARPMLDDLRAHKMHGLDLRGAWESIAGWLRRPMVSNWWGTGHPVVRSSFRRHP